MCAGSFGPYIVNPNLTGCGPYSQAYCFGTCGKELYFVISKLAVDAWGAVGLPPPSGCPLNVVWRRSEGRRSLVGGQVATAVSPHGIHLILIPLATLQHGLCFGLGPMHGRCASVLHGEPGLEGYAHFTLPPPIVLPSEVRISQKVLGFLKFLELTVGLLVPWVFVGMIFQGPCPVLHPYLFHRWILRTPQNVKVVIPIYFCIQNFPNVEGKGHFTLSLP